MSQYVTTEQELTAIVGEPNAIVASKVRSCLDECDREWLAASPFMLLATTDAQGRVDVSPKGDPAGIAYVIDDHTLVLPDRPGNRRVDGLRNVLQNPQVGMIFLVPGRGDTLRVNGRARIVREATYLDELVVQGHRPALALEVDVQEVFFHCSKAFLRSKLWDPATWDPERVRSRARITKAQERKSQTLEEIEAHYDPQRYATTLYTA